MIFHFRRWINRAHYATIEHPNANNEMEHENSLYSTVNFSEKNEAKSKK